MSWIDKIQEAIDFIEANLLETVTIEMISRAINYTPSAFQNLFSAVTGYSVGEYIRFRRLSLAADDLVNAESSASVPVSVIDTAFKYGYETPEAFSKAFKRLFDCPPSKISGNTRRFNPIKINYKLQGGFNMAKNFIPNLLKVDWSDAQRQNEFVSSVVSAFAALGESLDYDYVCAVSGSAFRTSFSMPPTDNNLDNLWNHGNYHVIHTPYIIAHTFKMLGYKMSQHICGNYDFDKKLIIDSIDKGVPVITLEGVINCSDACVISGYDNDGDVLLGYNPFMYINDDHNEPHDDTGYFRKSNWHDVNFAERKQGRILTIEDKGEKLSKEDIFAETLKLIKRLILEINIAPGQFNGIAAHSAFANTLLGGKWSDNFAPYLNLMCNYKQYLDRQYAVKFFYDNGRADLAGYYEQITELCCRLSEQIPQDFSAVDMFSDKEKLRPYCDTLLQIADIENKVAEII